MRNESSVQSLCVASLIEIGPQASDALIEASKENRYHWVPIPTLVAEEWGDAAIPTLKKLLDDPEPSVRARAAHALKELGDKPPPASQPGKP